VTTGFEPPPVWIAAKILVPEIKKMLYPLDIIYKKPGRETCQVLR
jgi:hypothetical protein